MTSSNSKESASLIGDIVASRKSPDRPQLHSRVRSILDQVNEAIPHQQPLAPTVGDEFQAVYRDLASAVHATLLLRLLLVGTADVRFGLGWGSLDVFTQSSLPFEQDGPAWWAARDAIERVSYAMKQKEGPKGWRTACLIADTATVKRWSTHRSRWQLQLFPSVDYRSELAFGVERFLNGFLICRDEIVDRMDERDARITLALLRRDKQRAIAREERISQSAIAQRLTKNGAYAVVYAHQSLIGEDYWNPLVFG